MTRFFRLTVATAVLALASASPMVHAHSEHGKPQFGGVVAEAGSAQFEVVAAGDTVTVHVSNHGQPLDTAGASGKLSVLVGTAKTDIELKPAAKSQLVGKGKVPAGAKMLLNVRLADGNPLQARAVMP